LDLGYAGGTAASYGGTSASTPIFSAIITRLNEARLGAGKKPIGFLNPSLYANPGMLNDITNGMRSPCLIFQFQILTSKQGPTLAATPLALLLFLGKYFSTFSRVFANDK
jgi:tripeptidyl-peptidase-1